ncbi:diguanylate phosphodiesterase [Pseudomonas sp. SWI36]|nr:diguanylate phosphodiesterase [Pseudomonas sp. SWI36]
MSAERPTRWLAPALPVFAGKPAPTTGCVQSPMCVHQRSVCRSGFTREYGSGGDGERRVKIDQQARPFRG